MNIFQDIIVELVSRRCNMHPATARAVLEFGASTHSRQWLVDRLSLSAGARIREKARLKAATLDTTRTDRFVLSVLSRFFWLFDKDSQDGN